MPFKAPSWARKLTKQDLRFRLYSTPGGEKPTHEYGYWWAEWGGTLDTIKDNEAIRDELLAVTLGIWDHIKNGPPEDDVRSDPFQASHWALDWVGFLPGKRESRRFIGQHVLTEQDVLKSRKFEDAIAYGGWPLDLHPPQGIDATDQLPCQQHPVPLLYDIPLRCCVARDVSNLMFAGRNISATHVAFSSTRVMATCAVIGQGVGTTAAFAAKYDVSTRDLAGSHAAMQEIQHRLLRDDAFLIGYHDPYPCNPIDLAKLAMVSASSEIRGGEASKVVSGVTRSVHGKRGAPPGRTVAGSHRWMSDPDDGLPVWIELDWISPIVVQGIQLTFDTGLHRHLTLSHHDGYASSMQWGRPQVETVADYWVEICEDEDDWETVWDVSENYQRIRRHQFPSSRSVRKMRIHVTETNGIDHARIVEVRVETNNLG